MSRSMINKNVGDAHKGILINDKMFKAFESDIHWTPSLRMDIYAKLTKLY